MEENSIVNILIVDDEKKACTNLRNLLVEYVDADINIAGLAHNTLEAEKQINDLHPDAVFLDIEMPKENAFHFLERISPFNFEVIFVTSYDEYAIRAFKLNAIDYILKPISINELKNAVNKLREKLKYKNSFPPVDSTYTQVSNQISNKAIPHKIILRSANSSEIVDFDKIHFIEAQGSYSKIVFAKNNAVKEVVMSNPLSDYEELLPADMFYRIHRSYLINCSFISKILKDDSCKIILKDNSVLPVSRRRYPILLEYLKNNRYFNG